VAGTVPGNIFYRCFIAGKTMTIKRWFPSFAPVTTITIAAILTVGLAALSTTLALRGPWLGVVFDRSYVGTGIRVDQVVDGGPAAGKLKSGDIIRTVATRSLGSIEILSFATLEDPHYLSSFAEYNSFIGLQQHLWEIISSPSFTAILSDGRKVDLASANFPGLQTLPVTFWWLMLCGGASFLLGVSVWSLRSSDPVVRVLAISGMGFMIGAYCCVIYVTRELAMPAAHYFALVSASHFGFVAFAYAAILTFWYYPRKLGNGPAAWFFAIWGIAIWLNETLQWRTWPAHPFYAHFVVAYCLLFIFTVLQWRKSRSAPMERAMLRWMLTTMSVTLGLNIVLFCLPIIFSGKPIASTALTFASIFVFYLGLVIGIIRYQQFDMERWWLRAWQWMLLILVILAADAVFVYFLNLNKTASGAWAIVVGIMYLRARQWLWGRLSGNRSRALDRALPHLVGTLMQGQHRFAPESQWQQLIVRVFNPLKVKTISARREAVNIDQSGLTLQLPSMDGLATIEAFCCDQGKRLFIPNDVKLANQLLELMRHSRIISAAYEEGALEERHRIQRDLHDDVAARLLSLLHQTHEPMISKVARNALRGLRDVVHLLGAEEALLEDVITDIEANVREQLAGLEVHLEWRTPDKLPALMLSSQQQINLQRIAREAIANALKHAHPQHIMIAVDLDNNGLGMRICNDGAIGEISGWIPGRGVNNIKYRVAEMGGSHKWGIDQDGVNSRYCYLDVRIPLSLNEQH
jgi:signal transduction histidine kinase